MFDSILNPIKLEDYETVHPFEGTGNFAVKKYYKYPFRPFYRKKLYMIRDLMDKGKIYKNILDFGSGPGIFTPELKRHAITVTSIDEHDTIDRRARFECIVAASSLEFMDDLDMAIGTLYNATSIGGQIIVASPMDTWITKSYFMTIKDGKVRNGHQSILSVLKKWFKMDSYHEWMGLYFSFKGHKV